MFLSELTKIFTLRVRDGSPKYGAKRKGTLIRGPREDEAVAIKPFRGCWIVAKTTCAVEQAPISAAKREAEVTRAAGMNRINREATSLGRCLGKSQFAWY